MTVLASFALANAPLPQVEPTKIFPLELGNFHLIGVPKQAKIDRAKATGEVVLIAEANYSSASGARLRVSLFQWERDSAAYADLTNLRKQRARQAEAQTPSIGTASSIIDHGVVFFKGTASATVISENQDSPNDAIELARLLAARLDDGDGDIPVLIKHLPNWETVQRNVIYTVDGAALREAIPNQPVLDVISFDGGTEAVTANYGQSQLVIIEFTTPQFSIDNDQRIWTKIAELKNKGEPGPTAYRRVGNYSVFVFNAPDEKTANALVDQVKYEQVVQWLGEDPHLYERLQKYLTQTSAGLLVAVLKSSGLSLLLCLAAGALIGTMLFRHRRAQKAAAYSDAGGSIRLNLDDLTGPAHAHRLLTEAKPADKNSAN